MKFNRGRSNCTAFRRRALLFQGLGPEPADAAALPSRVACPHMFPQNPATVDPGELCNTTGTTPVIRPAPSVSSLRRTRPAYRKIEHHLRTIERRSHMQRSRTPQYNRRATHPLNLRPLFESRRQDKVPIQKPFQKAHIDHGRGPAAATEPKRGSLSCGPCSWSNTLIIEINQVDASYSKTRAACRSLSAQKKQGESTRPKQGIEITAIPYKTRARPCRTPRCDGSTQH